MCNTNEVETVYIVIVECTKYERERNVLKQVVSDEWEGEFFSEIRMDRHECRKNESINGIVGGVNMKGITAVKEFLINACRIRSTCVPLKD